jgi:hypothetical protein
MKSWSRALTFLFFVPIPDEWRDPPAPGKHFSKVLFVLFYFYLTIISIRTMDPVVSKVFFFHFFIDIFPLTIFTIDTTDPVSSISPKKKSPL